MTKKLKHNLVVIAAYALFTFLILIPLFVSLDIENWLQANASVSTILGFLFSILNDITTQLRKLNGEKFPQLDEPVDEEEVGQINS